MENKNLPELHNPMINMTGGGFPITQQLIQNLIPLDLPRPSFDQNPVSLFFGNIKIKQIAKTAELIAQINEATLRSTNANLEGLFNFFTFSSKTADTLASYEHNKEMRKIQINEGNARVELIKLEGDEKKANIQQINYQTALLAQEVEAVKLDNKIKFKNSKEILGEE